MLAVAGGGVHRLMGEIVEQRSRVIDPLVA